MIHIISGAPCSGKTTYIEQHKNKNDIVIDTDKLAKALGAESDHKADAAIYKAALDAREIIINNIQKYNADNVWIIDTRPCQENILKYNSMDADFITLDPGKEVCLERAKERPEGTAEDIEDYYNRKEVVFHKEKNGLMMLLDRLNTQLNHSNNSQI